MTRLPVTRLLSDRMDTPLGELVLLVDEAGDLRAIDWTEHAGRMHQLLARQCKGGITVEPATDPGGVTSAMQAYFAGSLSAIDGLPVSAAMGTPFQRAVWDGLRAIPAGVTLSYGALAARLGCPAAVRAVGMANGSNPVSIVVPCHRVIGADGTLTGYGGGLHRKRWLLAHEGGGTELPLA